MRRRSLTILASLIIVFAVVFAFQSPPAEVSIQLIQPTIERVKNVCVEVSAPGLYSGEDTRMPAILRVNANWMAPNRHPSRTNCLRSVSYSAVTSAITPNPRDMISKDVRDLRYLNDEKPGQLYVKKSRRIAYGSNNLVALPSRPVLLM